MLLVLLSSYGATKLFWGYLILLFYSFQLVFVGHYSFTVLNFDETDIPKSVNSIMLQIISNLRQMNEQT